MVEEYQEFIRRKQAASAKRVWGTQEVIIDEVVLDAGDGVGTDQFRCGGPLVARIRYTAKHPVPEPVFGFAVADINGHVVYGNNTQIEKCDLPRIDGKGEIAFRIEPLGMSRGTYLLSFSVHSADHKTNYFRLENTHQIHVTADKSFEGCFMPCRWSTK